MLCALSIFTSSSTFATLTSHKEWGVRDIKLTVNSSKSNPSLYNFYLKKAKDEQKPQWLQATSKMNEVKFSEENNNMVTASADTSYFLGNFLSNYQIYKVTQSVCTMKKDGDSITDDHCSYSSSIYSVGPEGAEFSSGNAAMSWSDVKPGEYIISFGISVENTDGDTVFSTYDYKFLTVPETAKK